MYIQTMSFIDYLIWRCHIYAINHAKFTQLLVTHNLFQIKYRKKETHMFHVASVIIFSVFLKLLWKSTSLVRYKLNIFRPPWVNKFLIRSLLVCLLRQVNTVKINGILWLVKKYLLVVTRCYNYLDIVCNGLLF